MTSRVRPEGRRRRSYGWLDGAVLAYLGSHEPAKVQTIASGIREADPEIFDSAVFRAIKRLHRRGDIFRIESLRSYALRRADAPATMICGSCGQTTEVDSASIHAMLATAAAGLEFKPRRVILEVIGRCSICAHDERLLVGVDPS